MNRESFICANERGSLIPIIGAFFAVLIFFLFGLALDSGWVKRARSDAQKELEQICQQAVDRLPISGSAFETFNTSVNLLNADLTDRVRGATLREIRLLSPVNSSPFNALPPSFLPPVSFPFGCPGGVSCTARHDLDSTIVTNYPPQFWSTNPDPNIDNYGAVLGCELYLDVKSLIPIPALLSGSGPRVQAKTVWRQILRGVTDPAGGVLLGIAPHVVTPDVNTPGLDRFEFLPGSFPAYDPLRSGAAIDAFTGVGGGVLAPLEINSFQWPALTQNSQFHQNQLIACSNPLTVARGVLLSGIVGRAAKSSLLRTRMEIDLVGTVFEGSTSLSPGPASIVPFGQDLAVDVSGGLGYYLPAVDFYDASGNQASMAGLPTSVSSDEAKLRRAFLQLTTCMHIYSGVGPNGLDLPEDPNTQNIGYEDPGVTQEIQLVGTYVPSSDPWPQEATNPRRAQEIVAALGTIQGNPTGDIDSSGLGQMPGLNAKENLLIPGSLETLRPDIAGFVNYVITSPFGSISHLILVLHQPPTPLEAAAIAPAILALPADAPPITVIYMPYRDEDVQNADIANAFLPASGGVPYVGPNTVLYLEPIDDGDGIISDQEFQDYWHDLIDSGVEKNAEKIASEIWLNRITRRVLGL